MQLKNKQGKKLIGEGLERTKGEQMQKTAIIISAYFLKPVFSTTSLKLSFVIKKKKKPDIISSL